MCVGAVANREEQSTVAGQTIVTLNLRLKVKKVLISHLSSQGQGSFFLTLLILSIAAFQLHAAEPLTPEQAVAEALKGNPGLASIKARADALAAIPDQRGTLPDPKMSVKMINLPIDSFSSTQEGMTQLQIGFSQGLPFPGKLRLRKEVAQAIADAAGFDVAELRLRLARDVKMVWWNIFYLDRALDIVDSNQTLLRQFVEVAESKYSVGQGLQQDVLLAQVELSKLLDSQIHLEGQRRNEVIRLNTLLDYQATAPVVLPAEVSEDFPPLLNETQLMTRAMAISPMLAMREQQVEAAKLRVALAKKDYYPDFNLGAAYGLRNGNNPNGSSRDDFATIMLSMNLPIYTDTKQDRAVDQRNSERLQQRYALQDERNQVAAAIGRALSDYRRGEEKAVLFKTGIIPQASQTVASMLAGYQVNKVDFLNVVRSQITLY
ncbi:Heavy metal RND efflux outer membrane protein, CzcC family, partial [hydrothermal vent metagenome]